MRKIMLAACVAALAYVAPASAQQQPKPERMRFQVESIQAGRIVLRPMQGDSTVVVHSDSLSRTIRRGQWVRRCNRPVHGTTRVVTWCRDARFNASQTGTR